MRLFLASSELDHAGPDARLLAALTGLVARPRTPTGRTAIVLNARDEDPNTDRAAALAREATSLGTLATHADELDLRAFKDRPAALREWLQAIDLLWVTGGSAHALRAAMHGSGFPALAAERVAAGTLVYAGYSAGAIAAGRPQYGERLAAAPDGDEQPIWGDLGLVEFAIVPHQPAPGAPANDLARVAAHLRRAGWRCESLVDGQAIVVDDAGARRVGPGVSPASSYPAPG